MPYTKLWVRCIKYSRDVLPISREARLQKKMTNANNIKTFRRRLFKQDATEAVQWTGSNAAEIEKWSNNLLIFDEQKKSMLTQYPRQTFFYYQSNTDGLIEKPIGTWIVRHIYEPNIYTFDFYEPDRFHEIWELVENEKEEDFIAFSDVPEVPNTVSRMNPSCHTLTFKIKGNKKIQDPPGDGELSMVKDVIILDFNKPNSSNIREVDGATIYCTQPTLPELHKYLGNHKIFVDGVAFGCRYSDQLHQTIKIYDSPADFERELYKSWTPINGMQRENRPAGTHHVEQNVFQFELTATSIIQMNVLALEDIEFKMYMKKIYAI